VALLEWVWGVEDPHRMGYVSGHDHPGDRVFCHDREPCMHKLRQPNTPARRSIAYWTRAGISSRDRRPARSTGMAPTEMQYAASEGHITRGQNAPPERRPPDTSEVRRTSRLERLRRHARSASIFLDPQHLRGRAGPRGPRSRTAGSPLGHLFAPCSFEAEVETFLSPAAACLEATLRAGARLSPGCRDRCHNRRSATRDLPVCNKLEDTTRDFPGQGQWRKSHTWARRRVTHLDGQRRRFASSAKDGSTLEFHAHLDHERHPRVGDHRGARRGVRLDSAKP
jgi:hypothetical protein